MEATALYNLAPAARLALLGALIAGVPLAWLWVRHRRAPAAVRLRALTAVTLFLTFDLVLFGAFTRLTDSGLGCPDWPGCYGHASPLGAQAHIAAEQSLRPSGPVTHDKAWVEMVHRYLATAVGALITVIAIVTWRLARRRETGVPSVGWAAATLAWVCIQGAFGALTVTMKLYPAIVTLHLLGGLVLLALLAAQVQVNRAQPLAASGRLGAMVGAVLALSVIQIALGGWVSTNYAVLACRDFPTCQGSWWPPMDFAQAFTLLRPLGETGDGGWLPFEALTAIHYVHRLMAVVVVAVLLALAGHLHARSRAAGGSTPVEALWLAGIAVWQVATGLSNVLLEWPLLSAVAHTGGAALLVIVLTSLGVRLWQGRHVAQPRRADAPSARGVLHHV